MTYQYVTKSGALKSFDAADDTAALSAIAGFTDAAPNGGVIKAPSSSTTTTTSAAGPTAPPTQAEIAAALAKNPDYQAYSGNNTPAAILSAYQSGDWSGVTSLSGKPFTDAQQQAAVASATSALAPAYNATKEYDTENTEDALSKDASTYAASQKADAEQFTADKNTQDLNAANNGVLYSGGRAQKLQQLSGDYTARDTAARATATDAMTGTARDYAYAYGSPEAGKLSDYYSLPGGQAYNANVAGGKTTKSPTLSAVYSPYNYNYQGTKPAAQSAAVQTRAAGLLANTANKMSLNGYATKL